MLPEGCYGKEVTSQEHSKKPLGKTETGFLTYISIISVLSTCMGLADLSVYTSNREMKKVNGYNKRVKGKRKKGEERMDKQTFVGC